MFAEAPARSVAMTEGPARIKLRRQAERPESRRPSGGACGTVVWLDGAAARATIPEVGCRPSRFSTMGSAVLRARNLALVFFGDRGGQVTHDPGQLAKCTRHGGEADALKRFAKVLPCGVELRPQLSRPAPAAVGPQLWRRQPTGRGQWLPSEPFLGGVFAGDLLRFARVGEVFESSWEARVRRSEPMLAKRRPERVVGRVHVVYRAFNAHGASARRS